MAVSLDTPSFALIDGCLCRVNRRGTVTKRLAPLGGSVAEFRVQDERLYVREHPEGGLSGMPNLYCLDLTLRLLWLAELPSPEDPFASIASADTDSLHCRTVSGRTVHVALGDGRIQPAQAR